MLNRIKQGYNEFPGTFKVLTLVTFIDSLGKFFLFPFFALYITAKFSVGMIVVGIFMGILSGGNLIGGFVGGALADRFGRRFIILFGLIGSGIGSLFIGLSNSLLLLLIFAGTFGILNNLGAPARQAMVADLLPTKKQPKGYGTLRISVNLSATIGPIIGGLLATQSYMLLFISDALSSLITAVIVFLVIPETKPGNIEELGEESIFNTIGGYKSVLKDGLFVAFCIISLLISLVYIQLNSTLSVFLRDVHGFPEQYFGYILSTNALMVVLFQFWIANKVSKYDPMKTMAFGALWFMVGFTMYGFVSEFYMFFVAMAIITVGEMITSPVSQTSVAHFAPKDKRGRYMAFHGFTYALPSTFGIILAGFVIEYIGPNWVWYFAGIISLVASVGFWYLRKAAKERFENEQEKKM